METIYVKRMREVEKLKLQLEKKLNVKIKILGRNVVIDGSSLDEYDARIFFDAVNFGFSVKKALLLKEEDFVFRVVHIKDYTKRNLKVVKSRLIGKKGKTRRTISLISGCEVLIKEGEVGIIGDAEDVEDTETAIINIIKGSKQSNVYRYLEKMNTLDKSDFSIVK
ncbi:MAG: hypothetical protein KJ600_00190 [Nanoarchaeota archaeon]|nr:hypothetical protein [Nanoarchaeota archaeon]MBU1102964.1 hypothetical protein [Nanoarchaeota archaeon]